MSTNTSSVQRTFRAGQRSGDAGRRRRSDRDDISSSSPSEPEAKDDMYHSSQVGSGGVWPHRRARGGGMPNCDHKTELRRSQVNNHQVPYYEFHRSPAPRFTRQLTKTYAEAGASTDPPNVDWLAEVVLSAHPRDQRQFLSALLHRLAPAEVFFVKQCAEEAEKRDFIGMLPPELVNKILDLLDIRTHAVIAQVCRCWNVAVGAIWKSACLRVGLNILSDDVDHYVRRVHQIRWRLRRWTLEPAMCLAESPPVPHTIDPATLTFFQPLNSREHGYLGGVVGPGSLLFQPAVDEGGATYFLRTGSTESPTSLLAMDAASVLVGLENGVVQRWDWRRNELLAMLPPHSSMSSVTALAHAPEWDLIATGSANSSISIYRASTCELLHTSMEIGISAGCSVVALRFLLRAVQAEDGSTVFRLFLGAMYLVQAMPFLNGTRMRSFANLSIFELCPLSGVILGQVFARHSTVEDENGVKTSLMIDEVGGCFSFLTVDYGTQQTGFDTTDNRTIYIHEYDPIMNQESIGTAIFISPSDVSPMSSPPRSDRSTSPSALTHFEHLISPQNQVLGLREWQLLGMGARYACVYVGELNHTGYLMKPGSGVAVFERPRPHSSYWKQVLAVEAPVESSVFSAAVMGERSWLDNFDGENDKGLIFAAAWFDFAHDSWQMTTYHWTKKQ